MDSPAGPVAPQSMYDEGVTAAFGACPTHWLVCQLADRWTLPVLTTLLLSQSRFAELQEALHPISHRMLSRSLQKLVRMDFVTRTVLPSTPPQVHYEASALGRSLASPLARVVTWSQYNVAAMNAAGTSSCPAPRRYKP